MKKCCGMPVLRIAVGITMLGWNTMQIKERHYEKAGDDFEQVHAGE